MAGDDDRVGLAVPASPSSSVSPAAATSSLNPGAPITNAVPPGVLSAASRAVDAPAVTTRPSGIETPISRSRSA